MAFPYAMKLVSIKICLTVSLQIRIFQKLCRSRSQNLLVAVKVIGLKDGCSSALIL